MQTVVAEVVDTQNRVSNLKVVNADKSSRDGTRTYLITTWCGDVVDVLGYEIP